MTNTGKNENASESNKKCFFLHIHSDGENVVFRHNEDGLVGRLSSDDLVAVVEGDDVLLGHVPHVFAALAVAQLTLGG